MPARGVPELNDCECHCVWMMPTVQVELFGGAMIVNLPVEFEDVSRVRQVPDHQEVWADARTDRSLIVEIVNYASEVDECDFLAVARYYWEDLVATNCALSHSIESSGKFDTGSPLSSIHPPPLPESSPISDRLFTIGRQRVSKFQEGPDAANEVEIFLCILRLPSMRSDVLISVNIPVQFAENSSSIRLCSLAEGNENAEIVQQIVATFRIVDFGLFGCDN